jgi:protein-disulfide isomerase
VSGTPTLLVNDLRFYGAIPKDTLDAYVRRALAARPRAGS